MITYKLVTYDGKEVSVTKYIDGIFAIAIPFDPDNQDFVEYQKWVAEGGVPTPADE